MNVTINFSQEEEKTNDYEFNDEDSVTNINNNDSKESYQEGDKISNE